MAVISPLGRSRFCLLCSILACLPAGCGQQAPAPEETASAAPVKWMEARQLFIEEWTELLGTTQALPDRAARVTAPVEGQVVSVLLDSKGRPVVEGQPIKKGDVIVRLDDRIARANRDRAEAAFEELKHQVQQADFAVELAQIEVQRLEKLSQDASPLVSPIDLKKARVTLEDAKSKRKGVELRKISGQRELQGLDEQLELYTLTAPLDGRLGRLQVVSGQTLSPGTLVTEIVDLDKAIDVLCFVPPRTAKRLRIGQLARIGGFDEQSPGVGSAGQGKVEFIADQAELDTGNFAVKVRFPNSQLRLKGNVTLRLRVLTMPGKAALTLPESAIMEDQDPPTVLVVEDQKKEKPEPGKEIETGKARSLRVKLGTRDRVLHLVEILGLEDPEKKWHGTLETAEFIVDKGQGLRTGDPVRLEAEDEDENPQTKN